MTHLCVSIYVNDLHQAQSDLAQAAERGAEMVELRVDTFADEQAVKQLVAASTLPVIVTCRSKEEGGRAEIDDLQRLALLTAAGEAGASYLDIEYATVADNNWAGPQKPRNQRPGWIYSSHNFVTRPANLNQLMVELAQGPCDVMKVAWNARSIRDNLEAFELMRQRQKPTVAICMGEAGALSRILAKKFGGFLSFASLDRTTSTAPGQVTVDDLKQLYRWDAQQPQTRVYGVVGSPVGHSMSPAIHNASFDRTGFDGVYVPLLVEPSYESFKAFMEDFLPFEPLHLSGLSVTIPHKENALRYLREKGATIEPLAEQIGAVNTVLIDRGSGRPTLEGRNTDYAAILDCITRKLGIERSQLKDYTVAVLGAGGTGRTAVAALAACGASVVVYNRTPDRAEALAREFHNTPGSVTAAAMDKLGDARCQIYVNTSSVGMHPGSNVSLFDGRTPKLDAGTLVFDSVYNPIKTKLLQQAEAAGAKTISGVDMFVRQAAAQFEAWTGLPAPTDVMRDVVVSRLTR